MTTETGALGLDIAGPASLAGVRVRPRATPTIGRWSELIRRRQHADDGADGCPARATCASSRSASTASDTRRGPARRRGRRLASMAAARLVARDRGRATAAATCDTGSRRPCVAARARRAACMGWIERAGRRGRAASRPGRRRASSTTWLERDASPRRSSCSERSRLSTDRPLLPRCAASSRPRSSSRGALPDGLEIRPVEAGPAPGDLRRRDRGVPGPLGPVASGPRATSRLTFAAPELDTGLWRRRLGRRPGRGRRDELDLAGGERRLGVQRGWLDHVSVRRPWRRRGLARA